MTSAEQASTIALDTGPVGQFLEEMNTEGLPVIDPKTGQPDFTPSPVPMVAAPPAGAIGYDVMCNGVTSIHWVLPPAAAPKPDASKALRAIYDFVSATVTLPHMAVAANPTAMGITGLASYFWISGYQGAPVTASKPDGTFTVNIVATPVSYTWGFGDGNSFTTPGQGPPSTASAVTHTYSVMSSRSPYALAGRYLVAVTASFDIRFQVTGPGISPTWQDFSSYNLGPLTDSATLSYPVGEIISDLTSNPK